MTVSYDFYSPFMQAVIVTKRGQRVPLWIDRGGPSSPSRIPARDRPYLQEISVKLNLGGVPVITAKLTPTYEEGIEYLDTSLSEWGESQLEVVFGYSTGGSGGGLVIGPPYTGLLLKPDIQIGPEISVTLNAQGVGTFNLNTQGSTRTLDGTRQRIVESLLQGVDTAPVSRLQLDVTEVRRLEPTDDVYKAWFVDYFTVPLGGRTPWQHISQLVWETRCWMFVDNTTVKVYPRSTAFLQAPKYILSAHNFDGTIGPLARVFPILSASSPTLGAYLPGVLQALAVPQTDSRTRAATSRTISDETHPTARSEPGVGRPGASPAAPAPRGRRPGASPAAPAGTPAPATAPGASGNQLPSGVQIMPTESAESAASSQIAAARAEWEVNQSSVGIKLELETLGVPDLIPGNVIVVEGLGVRIRGNYVLLEVTHTMGTSGFTTSMTAIKNVESVLQQGSLAFGPVNRRRVNRGRATVTALREEAVSLAGRVERSTDGSALARGLRSLLGR